MSGTLAMVVALAHAAASPAPANDDGPTPSPWTVPVVPAAAPRPAPLENAITVAIPALDGLRGLTVAYERFVPARQLSLAFSGSFRESATGDYTGLRTGGGVELRVYWRSKWKARLARLPAGNMVGWFGGLRMSIALDATHDDVDHRWLPLAVESDVKIEIGYRFVPWRHLEITPWLESGVRHELIRRVPDWTRLTTGAGLTVGWLF